MSQPPRILPIALAALVTVLTSVSCSISIVGRVPSPERSVVIAEIDALGKLHMPTDKRDGLLRIADREGLTDAEQVYYVEFALDELVMPTYAETALLALINGPSFSRSAKLHILDNIDRLSFPTSRQRVLRALQEKA